MKFGRYELVDRLGVGGMGEVWRAHDQELHRDVAVKFLPERFARDSLRLGRFSQEARAASSLNHPNIVTIHDIGETSGLPYIVMELVFGQTLREVVAEGRPLPARRVLEIGAQMADGLAKAHAAGIVHRDLKPENVMVTADGFVKLLDFGLAKLVSDVSGERQQWFDTSAPTWPDSPSPQTAVGAVLGTVGYMSPEQARGRAVDHRGDQFTLGAILYELSTGQQAFRADTAAQTLAAIIDDAPTPIATLNPQVPPALRWIIEGRCLAKDATERYAATEDLARELRDVRDHLTASQHSSPSPLSGVGRALGERKLARAATGGLLALAVLWGARAVWQRAWERGADPGRPLVVAVLPLTDLSGEGSDGATAAGIAQVVVDALSQVDGLEVLPRTATARLGARKGDLGALARDLQASYLVDGALQRSDNRLRVSLSLVRASSRTVEWGDTFDGAFPQVFELQSRVADAVARAARLRIPPESRGRVEARATASPSAWEDYSAALALLDRPDRAGNLAAAVARLERALAADPRFARAHAALARAALSLYDETHDTAWADRARDAAQEALRLDPRDVDVRRTLARTLASRGRLEEAVDEFKQALAQKPGSDETRRLYADVLADAGQGDAALEQAREAVALRPDYLPNQMSLGWVHYAAGRYADAVAAYRRGAEIQPDNSWPQMMLGTSLQLAGDLPGAAAAYERAVRIAPDARAWSNLGYVYYATGRLPEARRAYEEALRLEPKSPTMRRSLGDVRARLGDEAKAREDWAASLEQSRAALRVNPRSVPELKNAGVCLAKLGRKGEALEKARQLASAGPSSGEAQYGAAAVRALAGDARGALEALDRALSLGASARFAREDDDFGALRSRPEFQKVLERAAPARR
jgi:tetratricopeptide (TPR) repeat protein